MCQACPVRATYEAWNGQTYPWPPPEGWHEAPDGRWWAPDSGPDDLDPPDSTGGGENAQIPPPSDQKTKTLGALPGSEAGLWQPDESIPLWKRTPVVLSAGVVALLIVVTTAVALSGGDSDRTETDQSDETAATADQSSNQTSSSIGAGEPSQSASEQDSSSNGTLGEPGAADDGAVPGQDSTDSTNSNSATTASADNSTASTDNGQTETTAGAATTEQATTTQTAADESSNSPVDSPIIVDPADKARADELRAYLADNGLSGELINDADLVEFANTFCIFAITADSRTEYESSRNEAIADSSSELTQQELAVAVDGAIQTFCPDDAQRLGLGG